MSDKKYSKQTIMTFMGRNPAGYHGITNPPIVRASTILYPSLEAYEDPDHKYRYSNISNPLSEAFEAAMTDLEGGEGIAYKAVSSSTGLAPISAALLAFLKAGDHLLMNDSIYPPTRYFCRRTLEKYGVEVEYYDPVIGAGIEALVKDNTAVIYLESPGSATFEVQDIPAITAVAKAHGIITIADNTWGTGIFQPLKHGVNVSVCAATKYIAGHADVNLGYAVADSEETYKNLKAMHIDLGHCAGAEDLYNGIRGLRTMQMRIKQSAASALKVAQWLQGRDEVQKVYHPALESHATHDIWKRDFEGSNGLLSFLLHPIEKDKVSAFVNALELFPVGSSWGGYMSLLQPQIEMLHRKAVPWVKEGTLLRLHCGLEDVDDLIGDLEQAFEKMK